MSKRITVLEHLYSGQRLLRVMCISAVGMLVSPCVALAEGVATVKPTAPIRLADDGKFKMLYDARQRPQAVGLAGKVFVVFNGDASPTGNEKGRAFPMLVIYDVKSRTFSRPVKIAKESSSDHHDSPIIWADRANHLHVLYGCHKSPGVHLVSLNPAGSNRERVVWRQGSQIAPMLSYPCVFRMSGNRDLIYYRTDGHTSSWTYRVTTDNGLTWTGPTSDVTDLDSRGRLDWSSYQTKVAGKDRRYLHVVYIDYDDNKHDVDPQRFYNPKYDSFVSNEWKYNLSYLRIDSETGAVCNSGQTPLQTPIDFSTSKRKCQIWDTQWRGAGVPPAVALDERGSPVFLHVLSGDAITEHSYFYVRKVGATWLKTRITIDNGATIVSAAGDRVQAFDAKTGTRIWSVYSQGEGVTPTPALGKGMIYTSSGFEEPTIRAIRLDGSGDVTDTHIIWEQTKGVPAMPSPLLVGPHLYTITRDNILYCIDAEDGQPLWNKRLSGTHSASPVFADGRIYILSETGTTLVLEPGSQYKELASNPLDEKCLASMAVSDGHFFIRGINHLFCIGRPETK